MARRLGLLVGIGLFAWILANADLPAVWRQVRHLRWEFMLIFLFYAVIFGLDTFGWHFALTRRAQAQVRWSSLFRTRLAGEAVNYVTPTGYIGGEPVKALLLSRRHGIPLADGMASVVIAKTTLVFSMLLFILTGIGVTLATQEMEPSVFRWVWVVLPVLSLLLVLFLLAQFVQPFRRGSSLAHGVSLWARAPRLSGWLQRVKEKVREWDHAILSFYRQSPGSVLWSLGFHFLGWLAGAVEVLLILRLLGIPVSLTTAFSIEALWVLLKTAAFMIPASLGASEGLLLLVCGGLGISAVPGLALGLLRRAREMIWVGLGLLEFARGHPGWAQTASR
ncbi:MAG: flippase-like domain-containing protein [Candidatus Omnitrophica bacterium]|nr:flippase-like domain-containing protein [Candidatus Omnitrophota bacterium]